MKSQNLFSFLLLFCVIGYSQTASIADTVTVEELHAPELISDKIDVVETEPIHVAEEVIRLEVEEPRLIHRRDEEEEEEEEEELEHAVPYEVSSVHDEGAPVVSGDENCEKPQVVEEQLIERAERQADEDLLKALDTVLTKKETIEDVIRTEDVAIPSL